MQFPNQIVSELHIVGTQTRVDVDGTGGNQPTLWFGNLDRSVQSFINAPSHGSPIDFMGIAMDSSPITSSNLPGNPVVRERVFCAFGFIDLGMVRTSDQATIGARLQLTDNEALLYYKGDTVTGITSSISVQDEKILFENESTVGVAYDGPSAELRAYNSGNMLDWVNLTLQNGWTAKAGYYAPSYRFTPMGRLELRGVMTGGAIVDNTVVALMPIVPAKLSSYGGVGVAPTGAGTASKRVFYNTDGKLYVYGINAGGTTDLSLDGATFSYK